MPRQGDGPRNRIRAKWFLCVLLSQPNILCEDEGEGKGNFLSWKWIESLNPKRPELQIETTIEFLLKLLDSSSCQEKYQQDYEKISESAKNIFFSGDRKKDNLKSFLRDYLEKKISILKDVKTGPGIKKWIFTVVTWSRADVETNLIGLANSWETKASVDPIDSTKVISYSSLTPHNLPYSGAVKFIGRDKFLKNLHDAVQTDKLGAITAIKGMGGVGKTELAIQYCLQHLNTYTGGVCWVNARGEDAADIQSKVASDVIQFAISDLGLEPPLNRNITLLTQLRFCWKNWPFSNTPVLVVLDDVNNYAALKDFLPKYPRFKVLLTTRLQLGMSLNTLQLDVLKSRQAFKLLRILVDRQNDQIRIRNELWIAKKNY